MYQLRGKQMTFDHKLFSFEVQLERISYFIRPDREHQIIGRKSDKGYLVPVHLGTYVPWWMFLNGQACQLDAILVFATMEQLKNQKGCP